MQNGIVSSKEEATDLKRVNFFDLAKKKGDGRYDLSNDRSNNDTGITIYWIGTIKLEDINESSDCYPIMFTQDHNHSLVEDYEFRRHEDGALVEPIEKKIYQYNLSEIKKLLLKSKDQHSYIHVFLEENIDRRGTREVNLLCRNNGSGDDVYYGIESKKMWLEFGIKSLVSHAAIDLTRGMRRICIMINESYNWHK